MTPGARAAAAVELLETIESDLSRPADAQVASWFRQHRYAGGGDRRAINATVYSVLRRRAQIDWWLGQAGCDVDPRARVIAALLLGQGWDAAALDAAFDGGQYRPATLSERERAMATLLSNRGFDDPDQPPHVRGNIPAWMEEEFRLSLGDAVEDELAALMQEAHVDLRINYLKTDRDTVAAMLAGEGIDSQPTPFSPYGLRLTGRINLAGSRILRDGLAEPQDESSQVAALLTDARPGQTVVDYCAGAGGKTLALAAMMENRGRLFACDLSSGRLSRAAPRLARAGVTIVETATLDDEDGLWPGAPVGACDRVLVDAPCSGTGTWRRHPEARWRLFRDNVVEFTALQARILANASRLVAPGGRLVYGVCSLLAGESESVVTDFLAKHLEFKAIPVGKIWPGRLDGECPAGDVFLRLRPGRDGADGFFLAVMEREEKAAPILLAQ
jgi:16S rRNA (cytosine967-C5)-methyltransferase